MDFCSEQGANHSNSTAIARICNVVMDEKTRFYVPDSVKHHTSLIGIFATSYQKRSKTDRVNARCDCALTPPRNPNRANVAGTAFALAGSAVEIAWAANVQQQLRSSPALPAVGTTVGTMEDSGATKKKGLSPFRS